jgi:hypothetical protein
MGYGSYSYEAHEAMTQARQTLPQQKVFTQRECHPSMNPKGVKYRESRDSAAHPNSLSIVFALDVSGSMGNIPDLLARKTLPSFMKSMMDAGIPDPQVLFMALGNAYADRAPLQVGQFESSEKEMDQWLTRMYLEGGGGGVGETYELAMYFAAEHMSMDCLQKRRKKGYFFMTGDEPAFEHASKDHIRDLIGDHHQEHLPLQEVARRLEVSFEPFFLIPDQARRNNCNCENFWRQYLGDRVICMDDPMDTCDVAAALVALTEGAVTSVDQIAARLRKEGKGENRVRGIVNAITPWAKKLSRAA